MQASRLYLAHSKASVNVNLKKKKKQLSAAHCAPLWSALSLLLQCFLMWKQVVWELSECDLRGSLWGQPNPPDLEPSFLHPW